MVLGSPSDNALTYTYTLQMIDVLGIFSGEPLLIYLHVTRLFPFFTSHQICCLPVFDPHVSHLFPFRTEK